MSDDEGMPDEPLGVPHEPDENEAPYIGDPPLLDGYDYVTAWQDADRSLTYLTVRQAAEKYSKQERQTRRWIMALHPEQRMEHPLRGLESALDELVKKRQVNKAGHEQDVSFHEVITRDDPEWMKAQINSLNVQALSLTQALQTATRELESAHAERRSALESLTAIQGELESAREQLRLLQERPSEAPESPNTGVTAQPDKSIGRWFRRLFGAAE